MASHGGVCRRRNKTGCMPGGQAQPCIEHSQACREQLTITCHLIIIQDVDIELSLAEKIGKQFNIRIPSLPSRTDFPNEAGTPLRSSRISCGSAEIQSSERAPQLAHQHAVQHLAVVLVHVRWGEKNST